MAFTDWLACACAGVGERAAQALRATGDDLLTEVAFAAAAGHVLDFDDTFSDGIAHVSAMCAPAALVLAAHRGFSVARMLEAYAHGFEAMAAVAEAGHPALYDRGWHPTTVCGPVGAAVAAGCLLDLSAAQRQTALAVAMLRAGGGRAAFGSDGKALQVGLAAAAGVQAALLAGAGASVDPRVIHDPLGFAGVVGGAWPQPPDAGMPTAVSRPAIERNWIKLYPSCLGTHSAIEAASIARDAGLRLQESPVDVLVDPVGRQAAHLDDAADGLAAKFSIAYCVAHTLLHGPPSVPDFAGIDEDARRRASLIRVSVDPSLPQWGAVLSADGTELARVPCPRGAPERPIGARELAAKVVDLAGDRLDGVLDDPQAPAAGVLDAAGLRLRPPAGAVAAPG